ARRNGSDPGGTGRCAWRLPLPARHRGRREGSASSRGFPARRSGTRGSCLTWWSFVKSVFEEAFEVIHHDVEPDVIFADVAGLDEIAVEVGEDEVGDPAARVPELFPELGDLRHLQLRPRHLHL